jgi:large subunit ribosomal protein L23
MLRTPWDVIVCPLITEKSVKGANEGKYSFRVHVAANKIQIRNAIEEIYGVRVAKVNTLNVKGKPRRRGGRMRPGRTPMWKKAVVTLEAGDTIDLFEKTE